MKLKSFTGMALAMLLAAPGAVLAANTVLSDRFDGSESRTDPLPGSCGGSRDLAYQDVGTFQVSDDGDYLVADVFNLTGVDITALIYDGAFDPNNPGNNLVTPSGVDDFEFVNLVGGATYRLVVQQWCENNEGAWAVSFSGPGVVDAEVVRAIPDMTQGEFTGSEPTADTSCNNGPTPYIETGPMQVAASGTYYYTDISIEFDIDVCLLVYTAPFDPANPDSNLIGLLDDIETVDLLSGEDYYFVAQPVFQEAPTGEFFYVLAPPAPFRVNKALAGAWYNPQTNGQGMFVDVYENANLVFVGWYTFDLNRPVDGTAELGEPGHRWLTALGPIEESQSGAALNVFLARGGAFDATSPPIEDPQTNVGSMMLEFTDCMTATADYTLTDPQVSGTIPLQPLTADHVELCESFTEAPGIPGPL